MSGYRQDKQLVSGKSEKDFKAVSQQVLDRYQTQVKALKDELNQLANDQARLQADLENKVKTSQEYVSKQVKSLTDQVKNLQNERDALLKDLSAVKEDIINRTNKRDSILLDFSKRETELAYREEQLSAREADLASQTRSLIDSQNSFKSLQAEFKVMLERFNREKDEHKKLIEAKKLHCAQEESRLLELERVLNERQKSIQAEEVEIRDMYQDAQNLAQMAKIEKQEYDRFHKAVADLELEKKAIKETLTQLQDKEAELNVWNVSLARRRGELREAERRLREAQQAFTQGGSDA